MDWGSITQVLNDVYKNALPTNARAFLRGMAGIETPIDEGFFQPAELEALRRAAQRGLLEYTLPVHPHDAAVRELKAYEQSYKERGIDGFAMLQDDEYWQKLKEIEQRANDAEKQIIGDGPELKTVYDPRVRRAYKNPHIKYDHYDTAALDQYDQGINEVTGTSMFASPDTIAMTTIGQALLEKQNDGSVMLRDRFDFKDLGEDYSSLYHVARTLGSKMLPTGKGFDVNVNLGNPEQWPSMGNWPQPQPVTPFSGVSNLIR